MMITTETLATDLSKFTIGEYKSASKWRVAIWFAVNYFIFNSAVPWPYRLKAALLKYFGAQLGSNIVIKPKVRIKNPWKLVIGSNCWIGESVWIDNLEEVVIGSNVCLSQGAMLLTGNHDYTRSDFAYRLGKITIEDGVWIGAQTIVCPGTICRSHAILTVNSVASKIMEAWGIYTGNPAVLIRNRKIVK